MANARPVVKQISLTVASVGAAFFAAAALLVKILLFEHLKRSYLRDNVAYFAVWFVMFWVAYIILSRLLEKRRQRKAEQALSREDVFDPSSGVPPHTEP